jgi:hypothetical protein
MLDLFLVISSALARPCAPIPLATGATWVYTAKVAWSGIGTDTAGTRIFSWTTRVVSTAAGPGAVAAVVRGWPSELAWWTPGQRPGLSVVYCTRDAVYRLTTPDSSQVSALADSLIAGTRVPSQDEILIQLPLRVGQLFGRDSLERTDTFYAWLAERADATPPALRRSSPEVSDTLYQLVYRTLPDHQIVVLAPGLGVTRYIYSHHGTVAEADARLIRFQAGAS